MRRVIAAIGLGFWVVGAEMKREKQNQRRNPGPNAVRTCLSDFAPTRHAGLREKPQGYGNALSYKGRATRLGLPKRGGEERRGDLLWRSS